MSIPYNTKQSFDDATEIAKANPDYWTFSLSGKPHLRGRDERKIKYEYMTIEVSLKDWQNELR